jgi:molybdopterin molybdotransferase
MGKNVRREGEDLARGARALAAGTRLDVGAVALLGALDLGEVVVTRRPRIALLSTGDELRAPGSPGRVGTIPDASAAMLRALLAKLGGDPAARVHSVDDPAGTTRALEDALGAAELVVTAGGASKGEHDHVRAAVAELGGRMLIDDVAIKPGKPVCVARIGETPVVILPGNPGAAFVTFHAFGAPLLRGLTGEREPALVRGRLATRAEGARGRTELLRCRRELTDDGLTVHILPNQAPGAIVGLEQTDALAEIAAPTDAGALVPVHLL